MFCSKCGNANPDTAQFCNKCGSPLSASAKSVGSALPSRFRPHPSDPRRFALATPAAVSRTASSLRRTHRNQRQSHRRAYLRNFLFRFSVGDPRDNPRPLVFVRYSQSSGPPHRSRHGHCRHGSRLHGRRDDSVYRHYRRPSLFRTFSRSHGRERSLRCRLAAHHEHGVSTYGAEYGSGYPSNIDVLTSGNAAEGNCNHAGLLAPTFAIGRKSGYVFYYIANVSRRRGSSSRQPRKAPR